MVIGKPTGSVAERIRPMVALGSTGPVPHAVEVKRAQNETVFLKKDTMRFEG
jgi:hypothetical protein